MKAKHIFFLLIVMFQALVLEASQDSVEEAFTEVYDSNEWGDPQKGEVSSGQGSTIANTKIYRFFLQEFLKENNIKSVVDVGCGDWEFSKLIDWTGINYTGIDVVKSVIERDQLMYSKENVNFIHSNGIEMDLPSADLLIIKDVLMHLPNDMIPKIFPQFKKYKHCLITHNVELRTLTSPNKDISAGDFRNLDLTQPPFNLLAQKILMYTTYETYAPAGPRAKMVLYIKN